MPRRRTLLVLVAVQFLALAAAAQSEFGRASGGTIDVIVKQPRRTSGSFTLTRSTGAFAGQGYEGSLGGELLDDRLWFFASASVLPRMHFTTELPPLDEKPAPQPSDSLWPSTFLSLRSTNFTFSVTR